MRVPLLPRDVHGAPSVPGALRAPGAVRDQSGDDREVRAVPGCLMQRGEAAAVPGAGQVDPLRMPAQLLEQAVPVCVPGRVREPVRGSPSRRDQNLWGTTSSASLAVPILPA